MKTKFTMILTLFMALIVQLTFAQQKTVSGTVSDENGLPLIGATVVIAGTSSGTTTEFDGNYKITASQGDVLNFSYVGYSDQNITVGNSNTVNVTLQLDNTLDEVVVVAYGTQKKEALTGSVGIVETETIEKIATSNVVQGLVGKIAGVQVINNSGQPGAAPAVRIRGIGSINAAISTRTDKLHDGGGLGLNLEGQNMYIAIWDGGSVLLPHQEFLNTDSSGYRVSKGETLITTISNHATHVAVTMVAKGTNPSAKGMAPQATITSYDWSNNSAEVIDEITNNALLLSNHSYGIPGFDSSGDISVQPWVLGCYSSDAALWDQIAYNAPYYLMVASAGNNGDVNDDPNQLRSGYDKLTHEKNAKNNLVVASAKPLVFPNGNILIQEDSFSSQGPSDDGRIKPDITANGNLSFSSSSTSNDAYVNLGGTSMSSPNTSGTLLLLQQYYNELNSKFMKASTLKGLACHTATDDTFNIGPDPELGWGFFNAERAANAILDDSNSNAIILETNLTDERNYSTTFTTDGSSELSASICWTDPAGSSKNNSLNDPTPVLVNDLDLRLTAPDGTTVFFPWKLNLSDISAAATKGDNIVDTIENIDITTPTAGTYTIEVSHKGTLVNGSQDFSLFLTGSNITLSTNKNSFSNYSVWPNPTDNILNFRFKSQNNKKVYISLIDIRGRKVMTEVIANPEDQINSYIKVDAYTKGLYILKIKQGNYVINKKIIIN